MFFVVAVLVALAVPQGALASAPTITRYDFDETWKDRKACEGFPVEIHATATIVTHVWEEPDGTVRIIETYPKDHYVVTNLKTGATYSFANGGPWYYVQNPDGSSHEMGGGPWSLGVYPLPPYEPGWYRSLGHWYWVLDAEGNEVLWTWVGHVIDICAQLEA